MNMRSISRTTRVAIATIYIRFRNAREAQKRVDRKYGRESMFFNHASAKTVNLWSDLQAVLENVYNDAGPGNPKEFLRFTALRKRIFPDA